MARSQSPGQKNIYFDQKVSKVSVCLNIAEGSDRKSDAEFKRFLRMAITSAEEVVTGLYLALDLNYIDQNEFDSVYKDINNLVARINSLISKLC